MAITVTALSDEAFGPIADRWLPLIYRGAIEYQIPGKLDAEDLVQEGLKLLFLELTERGKYREENRLQTWEVDSNDFEKYFKSALFHRYVDLKRTQSTKKRDWKKEIRATDDYDPIENLMIASSDDPEQELSSDVILNRLMARLNDTQLKVLECQVNPSEKLLMSIREHKCPQCLYIGDSTPTGKCPHCLEAGFEEAVNLETTKLPSRVLHAEIENFLGMKRMAVSDCVSEIRQTYRTLDSTPDRICLKIFMEMFGYGNVLDDNDQEVFVPWPMASSCRYEEGTPTKTRLTYYSIKSILNHEEVKLLDFMTPLTNKYYDSICFTDLARRTGMTVHRVREAVDSIRVKLEFVDAGVPLKDIPKVI